MIAMILVCIVGGTILGIYFARRAFRSAAKG